MNDESSNDRIDAGEGRRRDIHGRWSKRRNRDMGSPDYRDEWYQQQCLHCRFFIPLEQPLGLDYGACANAQSPFDARIMYEHDGCDWFELNEAYDRAPSTT